eukprot:CAMPEP_0175012078 /NCGR_PEP_ID=MMETSP0005-20121125/9089_1 /TAXON_ID=420556 /ORGANISM="Ochromonas sp., Strain CCMP1393" /LENGTH=641 /DNA_ID=CAMNT_0016268235 /DNA_START=37 /DNA_END=1962 /DNA_ORIENTATION=-
MNIDFPDWLIKAEATGALAACSIASASTLLFVTMLKRNRITKKPAAGKSQDSEKIIIPNKNLSEQTDPSNVRTSYITGNSSGKQHEHGKKENTSQVGIPHPYTKRQEYSGCVYLDYNATTPIFPEVTSAMLPFLSDFFGNPSSSHVFSKPCRAALDQARINVGRLVNAANSAKEIYFTSCGTESDNRAIDIAIHHFRQHKKKLLAVRGVASANIVSVPHIITCSIEHPAVLVYVRSLEAQGEIRLSIVPVNTEGIVDIAMLKRELSPNTALVTIMHSNNEVGSIQPIREIANCVREFNQRLSHGEACVLMHSDAAQSLGKVSVDVQGLGVDLLTIVGHKFGAPKGVAALYIRSNVQTTPMLVGGGQERGVRGGTENVGLVCGLGEASRLAYTEASELLLHFLVLKLQLVTSLVEGFSAQQVAECIRFNGPQRSCDISELSSDLKLLRVMLKSAPSMNIEQIANQNNGNNSRTAAAASTTSSGSSSRAVGAIDLLEQLPNTVSVSFKNIHSHLLIHHLSSRVACSAGSACHAVTTPATAVDDTRSDTDKSGTNSVGSGANNSSSTNSSNSGAQTQSSAKAAGMNSRGKVSDVLLAMKVPLDFAQGTLRLSFGRHTTATDIEAAATHIIAAVKSQWATNGYSG